MRTKEVWVLVTLIASSPAIPAVSPFNGTWRPDPQRPPPDAKPGVLTPLPARGDAGWTVEPGAAYTRALGID